MAGEAVRARFRPGSDTAVEHLGDEVVLIHLKTDRLFVLNRTGSRIWELLSSGHEVTEIEQQVLGEFAATRDEVAADVRSLLESLQREQLITPDD
jgi:hypothetical protein